MRDYIAVGEGNHLSSIQEVEARREWVEVVDPLIQSHGLLMVL